MENVKNWINNFYLENKPNLSIDSCLFLIGNNGIGKTFNINKLCNDELNLFIININSSNCGTSFEFIDLIVKSISSSLIQLLTNNNKKKIIIIDEFDTLLSLDSTINISLLNILTKKKLKNIPIICISSLELIKKIGDIKKKCKIIQLNNPTNNDMFNIIKSIPLYNSIDNNNINNIIIKSNNNISQCLKHLDNINNKIYYNIDIIYNIDYIFNEKFNREILKKIIITEPWLIPLKYHENLIIKLNNKKCIKSIKNNIYKNFIYNFCFFDKFMYNNINEIAIDFFISSIYDIMIINNKKIILNDTLNFTKILSYLSLQKKYLKYTYNNNFPFYQIGNYHINIIDRKFIYYN